MSSGLAPDESGTYAIVSSTEPSMTALADHFFDGLPAPTPL